MWQQLWKTWTIDKPAAFGDWLWDVLVLQLAAWLNRLTWRKVVVFLPLVILIVAYANRVPVPPTLMLAGDLLAYIDVFSFFFLLSILSRATTILFVLKQATAWALKRLNRLQVMLQRLDVRHGREGGASRRTRSNKQVRNDDDGRAALPGFAWA
jgi:hypothetical protein